jgi:hypothetical protein
VDRRARERSFSGWPSCPRIHSHRSRCFAASLSSSSQRSRFFTGDPEAVFQPFFRQLWIQERMPFATYCESVTTLTDAGSSRVRRAAITARSSIRLLVVRCALPVISVRFPPRSTMAA